MGVNGYAITTRAEGTVLTGFGSTTLDVFNTDHENHVIHTAPDFLNSWEEDITQMRLTTAPTTASGLSLPTVLKDEHERLRYQIARIKQKMSGAATPPFWYTPSSAFSQGVQLSPTAARIEQDTAISIPNGVSTAVLFSTVVYDTASLFRGSGLQAPVDGVYICGATLAFELLNTGVFSLTLRTSLGGPTTDIAANSTPVASGSTYGITVETVKHLTAGTLLRTFCFQNSGSAQPVDTGLIKPAMWMSLVGRG